jgi:hypothetical protein
MDVHSPARSWVRSLLSDNSSDVPQTASSIESLPFPNLHVSHCSESPYEMSILRPAKPHLYERAGVWPRPYLSSQVNSLLKDLGSSFTQCCMKSSWI